MGSKKPKVFLKKDHGFNVDRFPLLAFAPMGGREKFLRESSRGDIVFIAGTLTHPTPEDQRGRLLARVQVGHRPVDTLAVLSSLGVEIQPHERNANGDYRWPDGLPLLDVKAVDGTPLLEEVFGDRLSGNHWATFAIEVREARGDDVAERLLELPASPVGVPDIPLLSREETLGRAVSSLKRYSLSGPPPSSWERRVGHELTWGSAYLLRLVGLDREIWKVGKAIDPVARCTTLSRRLVPTVTGCSWRLAQTVDFESELHAYEFEQAVLARLERYRMEPEREIVEARAKVVRGAWDDILYAGEWALRE